MRLRTRPTLLQANGALLFAAIGCALLQVIRILLPDEWSSIQAAPVWDALEGLLFIGMGWRLGRRIYPRARAKRMRCFGVPSIVQIVLCILVMIAGMLLRDDLTLLTGAFLQRLGFDVSRHIAQMQAELTLVQNVVCQLGLEVKTIGMSFFFHGALLSAWERRGTRYGLIVTSVMCTLLCSSCVMAPAVLVIALGAGALMASTGSIWVALFAFAPLIMGRIGVWDMPAGMSAARYGRLWAEIGGREGAGFLALETLLLGLVYYFLIRAVCGAKPMKKAPWKPRNALSKPMNAGNIFVLSAAVVTGLCMFAMDLLEMAGIF